ncbi:MAG: hypothetical protein CHACPFDD_03358 [Phycisphaerae bacterium]|nr:hypothetical protein [Phycisphaerae bacterium]
MTRKLRAAAIAALITTVSTASSQTYDINWYTIDGGGGTSSGGTFVLSGTIGQPDANSPAAPMTGGTFELVGGFWNGAVAGDPCAGFVPCDANCDGSVNGFDVEPFVGLLTGSGTPCAPCAGDANDDGSVNGFDVEPFVDALTGGGC